MSSLSIQGRISALCAERPEAIYRFELSNGRLMRSGFVDVGPDYVVLFDRDLEKPIFVLINQIVAFADVSDSEPKSADHSEKSSAQG